MGMQENKDRISTREEIVNKIMEWLGKDEDDVSETVLVGETGIGKTWLAKEVSNRVTRKHSSSYNVLWLHLNKNIGDEESLYQNLAAQLSIFPEFEEGEEHIDDLDHSLKNLKKKISEELEKEKKKTSEELEKEKKKKKLLLILDDEGSMTTEKHVMKDLNLKDFLEKHSTLIKTLVTRREEREEKELKTPIKVYPFTEHSTLDTIVTRRDAIEENEPTMMIKVGPLTEQESMDLLCKSRNLKGFLKSLFENKEINEDTLMSSIVSKSKGLPAAFVVLTKSLDSIKSLSAKQKKIFKELILSSKSLDEAAASKNSLDEAAASKNSLDEAAASKNAIDRSRYNPVLRLSYELLKPEETSKSPVIACFWHVLDFYKYSGCAYYRDLIVHWMLEGYFDPVKSVEKAYQDGHSILMDFMNRGILKIQEDNMVVPEMSMSNLLDLEDCGFFGRSCLGFNRVYGGDKTKGLGRIVLIDDMIQTILYKVDKEKKEKMVKTIIVSGNRLRREVANKFFEKPEMVDLEVVVLFDPTFHDLVESLSNLKKLRVLVIRDCDQIKNIDKLAGLDRLHVLEVSGASYLSNIPDDFFKNITQLQSLNLSGLAITSSPSTIENLSKLRCFILRECSELQDLPNFNVKTTELEVIDIRGAKKLESYFDRVKDWKDYKGKNKNFAHLRQLEHLDFSESRIIRLPIFHLKDSTKDYSTMPALTRLLVRNCTRLKRLPQLYPLTKLQFLDVSGSTMLVEMLEVCLEDKKELRILDISETSLPELADTINDVINLNKLLLRNCTKIKELPRIENLTHLEVFDVSGCNKLEKIDGSFENMSYLHEVNLSGTSLGELSNKISELPSIKKLIMKNCSKLKALPNLEKLINLEIFDVSGCIGLEKIDGSFEKMSHLHEVNLSGTNLGELPNKISELPNLEKLIIRNCSKLKALPNLEKVTHLEIIDVSGCTELEKIDGSFKNMSSLREVNLSGTQLKTFPELPEGPKQSIPCSPKRIVLSDSRWLEKDEWSQIKEALAKGDVPDGKSEKKLVFHGNRYKLLDPESPSNIVDINKSKELGTEVISKAEYVSIADNESANVSSIFDEFNMRSVKGCWVERCKNMENLFTSDEKQEKDTTTSTSTLETLWISNLPLMKSLNTNKEGFFFKNLKKLSIDCCPNIIFLFPKDSQIPDKLDTLRVTFCDQLERLFEVKGELPNLRKLYLLDLPVLSSVGFTRPNLEGKNYTVVKCPNWEATKHEERGTEKTEEISEDQPFTQT